MFSSSWALIGGPRPRRDGRPRETGSERQSLERAGPIVAVFAEAARANDELAELLERLHADRLRNLRRFLVDPLSANGPLRVDRDRAVDSVWALTSPGLHHLLTGVRGWSRRRYVAWLEERRRAAPAVAPRS